MSMHTAVMIMSWLVTLFIGVPLLALVGYAIVREVVQAVRRVRKGDYWWNW